MKLTYRGISYPYTPIVLATQRTNVMGKYRGAMMPFRRVVNPPSFPQVVHLMYRGIAYTLGDRLSEDIQEREHLSLQNSTVGSPAETHDAKEGSIQDRMRLLLTNHNRNVRRREQAMLARADEEIGLPPETAAHQATRIQGKTPHDFSGYDRSRASMS